MRKNIFAMCMAVLMMAGCAKETAPEAVQGSESAPKKAMLAAAGETVQITVTLPQVEGLETRVGLTENAAGGFDPTWQDGDRILIGDEIFTLVSSDGRKGTFSGKMPAGETFDVVYPAEASEAATVSQKADKDYSHIRYSASMKGVDSIEDIHFGHDWAGAHGGTFVQSGALKLVLNLPAGAADVQKVSFETADVELSVTVADGSFTGNTFTAYLPCGEIALDAETEVKITVFTADESALKNIFYPGTQTLYEGYLVRLVTSSARWQKVLSGKGSEYDPYLISNVSELDNIRNLISANTHTHFKMTADIDMSGVKDWVPINLLNEPYGIVFDGDGHKIRNFTCTHASWASFFGVLYGTVRNVTFEDATVTTTGASTCGIVAAWVGNRDSSLNGELNNVKVVRGKVSNSGWAHIGGLTGSSGSGKFINCSFDGTVERTAANTYTGDYHPVGGLLGEALEGVSFTGCSTGGTLTTASGRACGGIVGLCSKTMDIKDCSSTMNITARDDVAGGIVGYYGNGTISGCIVKSNITVRENGSGKSYVGGIAGHTAGSVVLTTCSYQGAISAKSQIVGGILGQCNASTGNGCTITKCYTSGSINGYSVAGGIIGYASHQGLYISDCSSTMDVTVTQAYAGGISGDLPKNSTVRNCFATGKITGSFALGGISGRAFGRQGASSSLDSDVATTMENCIAYNTSVVSVVSGGEDPSAHYSGGAVIGCSSRPNTLKNCWRKSDFVLNYYSSASLNVLFDHADSSPSAPLVQPSGSAKWFSPYHGKAASAGATLSSVAQSAGWSSEIWDFSGSVPVLK